MAANSEDAQGRVETFFDATASHYEAAYDDAGIGGRVLRERTAAVLRLLGEEPRTVVDAGMGTGILLGELDQRGWEVSGTDISSAMVEGAIGRLPHRAESLVRGSIHALPFADASFDAAVATGVLEYAIEDLDLALREISRVVRPGGTVVMSFPNDRAPVNLWRRRVLYPAVRVAKSVVPARRPAPLRLPSVSVAAFRRVIAANGLVVDRVEPVGARPLPAGLAHRVEERRDRLAYALAVQLVMRAHRRP
jgi:ubiquinone/menaquinone biosynthesis C-methylase UbiE